MQSIPQIFFVYWHQSQWLDRWDRTAYNIRKWQECEPSLSDLIKFMDQQKKLVNDRIFSREVLEYYSER